MNRNSAFIAVTLLIFQSCTSPINTKVKEVSKVNPSELWSKNPWPEIRKERIAKLLPEAMNASGVACWISICRENNNDPIASHIGGENASGSAIILFYLDQEGFHSLVFSPDGEATALDELDIHDTVVRVERGVSTLDQAAAFIKEKNFKNIAINTSTSNALADGLTHSQHSELEKALGTESSKLLSSEELIYESNFLRRLKSLSKQHN
jgi:Xaa-Pro dipeptidase